MTLLEDLQQRALRVSAAPRMGRAEGIGLVLALLSMATTMAGARAVRSDDVGGLGIIGAMPAFYWLGLLPAAAATVFLLASLAESGTRHAEALVPGTWLVALHLAPQLAHAHPRFSVVYVHLGFIRLVDQAHTGDILLDARFAWPGFFGAFVPSLPALSTPVLELLMRLWPAVITGAWTSLVAVIARRSYPTQPLIGPVAALLFVLLSWTGQDYFSPQSVGFFLYLALIVLLESGPLRPRGAWSSVAPILSRFATAGGDRPEARSTPSYVALLVLSVGAVVSHPLAPFFICAALGVLGLYGRGVAWRLLLLLAVSYLVWVGIAAKPFWIGELGRMREQLGSLLSNVSPPPPERAGAGYSAGHAAVVKIRSAVGLSVFLGTLVAGVLMASERFRSWRPALPLAPLAGIPVVAAGLQSYGGEMILRVYMFTLPMAVVLFARVLLAIPRRAVPTAMAAVSLALTPLFLITRFGNELFEMVTQSDWAATEAAYSGADARTLIVGDNSFTPLGYENARTRVVVFSAAERSEEWLASLRGDEDLRVHTGGYKEFSDLRVTAERVRVVFTPSQQQWATEVGGFAPGGLEEVATWLATRPGVKVLYSDGHGGWVFEIERSQDGS